MIKFNVCCGRTHCDRAVDGLEVRGGAHGESGRSEVGVRLVVQLVIRRNLFLPKMAVELDGDVTERQERTSTLWVGAVFSFH